jgi:hypothetical protein
MAKVPIPNMIAEDVVENMATVPNMVAEDVAEAESIKNSKTVDEEDQ